MSIKLTDEIKKYIDFKIKLNNKYKTFGYNYRQEELEDIKQFIEAIE